MQETKKKKGKKRSATDLNNDLNDDEPKTKRRRKTHSKDDDKDEAFKISWRKDSAVATDSKENDDNPLPDFIDIMTGTNIILPAISPYGHVLGYSTWCKILSRESSKNTCAFTKQPMTRRSLIKLTKQNFNEYKDKIKNLSEEDVKNI